MKASHKTMAVTILFALIVIAAINNVGALQPLKEQINGDKGWF
ncbi:hypothetical protein [Vibrio cionasavignyae]